MRKQEKHLHENVDLGIFNPVEFMSKKIDVVGSHLTTPIPTTHLIDNPPTPKPLIHHHGTFSPKRPATPPPIPPGPRQPISPVGFLHLPPQSPSQQIIPQSSTPPPSVRPALRFRLDESSQMYSAISDLHSGAQKVYKNDSLNRLLLIDMYAYTHFIE